MNLRILAVTLAAAFAAGSQAGASPQATPAPSPSSQPTTAATAQPSPAQTTAPARTMAPKPAPAKGRVKKIPEGKLTTAQVLYAVSHPVQEGAKLRAMHSVRFENLRVYHVPSALRLRLHKHADTSTIAFEMFRSSDAVAQTSNPLLNIFANIVVQNALNNTLNGNTVNLSLSNVLNSNNIGIGQVLGVYIGGGGIITTIVG